MVSAVNRLVRNMDDTGYGMIVCDHLSRFIVSNPALSFSQSFKAFVMAHDKSTGG